MTMAANQSTSHVPGRNRTGFEPSSGPASKSSRSLTTGDAQIYARSVRDAQILRDAEP